MVLAGVSGQSVDAAGRRIYDHAWRQVRESILERDGRRCQIRADGCLGDADQVDHIVPVLEGGPRLDPANLRAACRPCNAGRQRRGRRCRPSREW